MKKTTGSLLAIGLMFLGTWAPVRAETNECAKQWEKPVSQDHSRDLLTFLRSNPAWSWSWFQSNHKIFLSGFEGLASVEGVVGGDVKPDNVGFFFRSKSQIGFGLIDLDDGGRALLIGDLFQALSYNEAWHTPLTLEEALGFYLEGLKDKSRKKIDAVQEEFLRNLPSFDEGEWQRSLAKYAGDQDAFFKKFKLVSLGEASVCVRDLWASAKLSLLGALGERNILQMGARVKDTGGSAGIPRFVFLTKKGGELEVLEFKLQVAPGVSASGVVQLPAPSRIDELNRVYRGVGPGERGYLQTVTASGRSFLLRSREKSLYDAGDVPDSPKKIARHQNFIRLMFYWLGERHASQSERYRQIVAADESSLAPAMKRMTRAHLDEARRLSRSQSDRK
jgi:hypothetical protein